MSRRLTLQTREMGKLDLYLIYDYDGTWEDEWKPIQEHSLGVMLSKVSHEMVEHAVLGFSRPLVKALGLFPEGMLHKLPSRVCEHMKTCPIHIERNCHVLAKKMSLCFEPASLDTSVRSLGAELVRLWREKVYVVVVKEPVHA